MVEFLEMAETGKLALHLIFYGAEKRFNMTRTQTMWVWELGHEIEEGQKTNTEDFSYNN